MSRRAIILVVRLLLICAAVWLIGDGAFAAGLFFLPNCACCSSTTTTCGHCSSSTASSNVQADITGFSNETCSNCTDYNASFVLPFSQNALNWCSWDAGIGVGCVACDSTTWNHLTAGVAVNSGSGQRYYFIHLYGSALILDSGFAGMDWETTPTNGLKNCAPTTSLSVPRSNPPSCLLGFPQPDATAACAHDGSASTLTFL